MLDAEQRLDAFEQRVRYRSRRMPCTANQFTDQWLIVVAQEFLNSTSWPDADTPEDLVRRLRERRSLKSTKTRQRKTALRKKREAVQAARDLQGKLL